MARPNTMTGDFRFTGNVRLDDVNIADHQIGADAIDPGDPLVATSMENEFRQVVAQEATADAVAAINDFYLARGPATIVEFDAWLATPPDTASGGGGRTAIVDLLVNGVSVLTSTLVLDHSSVSRIAADATITTAALVEGDVVSLKITLGAGSTGTHPKGVAGAVTIREVGV